MRVPLGMLVLLGCAAASASPALAAQPAAVMVAATAGDGHAAPLGLDRPSIRLLTLSVGGRNGPSRITLAEARSQQGGVVHELAVVLAPANMRGTAFLVADSGIAENVNWVYVPTTTRVRKLAARDAYSAFLDSDFTYADLGFARRRTYYRFAGEEPRPDGPAYRIEGTPEDPSFYTRTVLWLAADSELPIERHFYDASRRLWKIQRFEDLTMIDGVPTLRHISMENLQAKTRTDIDVAVVRYDVALPASLFDPTQLPSAVHSPVWQGFGAI